LKTSSTLPPSSRPQREGWEQRASAFTRRLSLPADFVEDQTSAELKDGVLTVGLPKSPKNTPRKISVN